MTGARCSRWTSCSQVQCSRTRERQWFGDDGAAAAVVIVV
jgi:hypothetical protein